MQVESEGRPREDGEKEEFPRQVACQAGKADIFVRIGRGA